MLKKILNSATAGYGFCLFGLAVIQHYAPEIVSSPRFFESSVLTALSVIIVTLCRSLPKAGT